MALPGSTGRQTGGLRSLLRRPGAARPPSAARNEERDAERDEEVAAELYREYHRPLLAFVLRLTGGDRPWAEDVVQETMIRAWRNADRLDDRTSSLMPWL